MKTLLIIAVAILIQGCALTPEQRANMAAGLGAMNDYNNSPAALQQRQQLHELQMQMLRPIPAPATVRVQTTCSRYGNTVYCG